MSTYSDTKDDLIGVLNTALNYASLEAGRIQSNQRPSLNESRFNYQARDPNLTAPTFADIFSGGSAGGDIAAISGQVEGLIGTYFPNIAGTLAGIPEQFLADVLGGVKPFGIDSTIFDLVWNQARDRAYRQGASAARTREAEYSARGFTLPPGALIAANLDADRATHDGLLDVSRDQAMKDAEIKQDILKFAAQTAAQLKSGILAAVSDLFRAYTQLYGNDVDKARARAQAYTAFYGALSNYYGVELGFERIKLEAAETTSQVNSQIDRNRIALFGETSSSSAVGQATQAFANVAAAAASSAGSLVAQFETTSG